MEMLLNEPFYDALTEKILGFLLSFIDKMLTVANGRIVFFRTGDDYGTQRGLLMSRQQWCTHVQPGLTAISDMVSTIITTVAAASVNSSAIILCLCEPSGRDKNRSHVPFFLLRPL